MTTQSQFTAGNADFDFGGVAVEHVAAKVNRAILPVLVLDASGSIEYAKTDPQTGRSVSAEEDVRGILLRSLQEMKAKGVHEGAYVAAWYFNSTFPNGLLEVLPFMGIDDVDINTIPPLVADGATPVYPASFYTLSATSTYGKELDEAGVTTDAFVCLVTDGRPEGDQKGITPAAVKKRIAEIRDERAEVRLASLYFAVIGVGDESNKPYQQAFADEIGADTYIYAGDMSGGTIGKIVGWFSSSVHLSQQQGGSQAVDFDTD